MRIPLLLILSLISILSVAQSVVSGPFQGHTTSHSTKVWFLGKGLDTVQYKAYNLMDSTDVHTGSISADYDYCHKNSCPFKFELGNLKELGTYNLQIIADGKILSDQEIQTIRNYDVDDFSFLIGSCAFIGTGKDKLYKLWNSTRIFNTLAAENNGDFMLWMGDNVYLMGKDYKSLNKSIKRYAKVRQHKKLNRFLKTKFHYAIWDDHDYGPNNCDGTFPQKENSKMIFDAFWQNPNVPHKNGIYFSMKYADIELFMLDDRYNRNDNKSEKELLGKHQMDWLKAGLTSSTASFKIIVCGNQMLNEFEGHESFMQYKKEKDELFNHIRTNQISGVLFFSGDRHHSEILRKQETGIYPFYDFTCSALTSWRYPLRKLFKEGENDLRIKELLLQHNYAVVSVSGIENNRAITVTYKNKFGKVLQSHTLRQQEISY